MCDPLRAQLEAAIDEVLTRVIRVLGSDNRIAKARTVQLTLSCVNFHQDVLA